MSEWISGKILPAPNKKNPLRSIKVINQDGDSVYYSYGYKKWDWWLAVNYEEEGVAPAVTHWMPLPKPPGSEE